MTQSFHDELVGPGTSGLPDRFFDSPPRQCLVPASEVSRDLRIVTDHLTQRPELLLPGVHQNLWISRTSR